MQETNGDHDLLIRIETKVDAFLAAQVDHETRLRIVEADREQIQGSLRVLKGIAGILGFFVAAASMIATWAAIK